MFVVELFVIYSVALSDSVLDIDVVNPAGLFFNKSVPCGSQHGRDHGSEFNADSHRIFWI